MDPSKYALMVQEYTIKVNMPSLRKYCGSTGPYFIKIIGEDMDGDEIVLKDKKFEIDETYVLKTKARTVGKIRSIVIRKTAADTGKFACNSIEIG